VSELLAQFPNSVGISALTGQGIDRLIQRVSDALAEQMVDVVARLPYSAGDLIALIHRYGAIHSEEQRADSVIIRGQVPPNLIGALERFLESG
jgi:GTP-binding protein HflX